MRKILFLFVALLMTASFMAKAQFVGKTAAPGDQNFFTITKDGKVSNREVSATFKGNTLWMLDEKIAEIRKSARYSKKSLEVFDFKQNRTVGVLVPQGTGYKVCSPNGVTKYGSVSGDGKVCYGDSLYFQVGGNVKPAWAAVIYFFDVLK